MNHIDKEIWIKGNNFRKSIRLLVINPIFLNFFLTLSVIFFCLLALMGIVDDHILKTFNLIFVCFFTLESILKIIAFGIKCIICFIKIYFYIYIVIFKRLFKR